MGFLHRVARAGRSTSRQDSLVVEKCEHRLSLDVADAEAQVPGKALHRVPRGYPILKGFLEPTAQIRLQKHQTLPPFGGLKAGESGCGAEPSQKRHRFRPPPNPSFLRASLLLRTKTNAPSDQKGCDPAGSMEVMRRDGHEIDGGLIPDGGKQTRRKRRVGMEETARFPRQPCGIQNRLEGSDFGVRVHQGDQADSGVQTPPIAIEVQTPL